jgi:hypothetical protein
MMTLTNTGTESGIERWEEPDHSAVEYRAADGAVLRFEAFRGALLGLRRTIGAKINAHHGRFESAEIDSHYFYLRVDDQTYDIVSETSSANNAAHLEQHESKHSGLVGAPTDLPDRVEALCRAQWRGARFRYVVGLGELDPEAVADARPFPEDFPQHWPSPGGVEINTAILDIVAHGLGSRRTAMFTVRNKGATPQTITVHQPSHYSFEVTSGDMVIPAGESVRVPVRYLPEQLDTVEGSLRIDTPSGSHEIELVGRLQLGSFGAAGVGGGLP